MTISENLQEKNVSKRLYSLDALRGFDMFWIMGAEEIVHLIAKATGSTFWEAAAYQLSHPEWHGFRMYDLIFPMFLFMAGVSTPYALGRELEKGKTREQLLLKVIKRGLILVILGIIYNNGLEFKPIEEIRFGSVLARIGLGYLFANIIFLYTKKNIFQMIWFGGILIFYYLMLKFNSAPGFPMGDLTQEGNFASYLDRLLMPGRLYKGNHDPEGLTSTIPAIATGLLGIITGNFLKNNNKSGKEKSVYLFVSGVAFILFAQIWNLDFPINKNIWSSSFVLQAGGISLVFLSIFYYIIDVLEYRKWAFFFKVIGMNSILIYLSNAFINWEFTTDRLFHWLGQLFSEPYSMVVLAICYLGIKWCFLYFFYKKNMFLSV
ncbi:acyltransferase family protein [Aquirufa sp. ROCK2-A2]